MRIPARAGRARSRAERDLGHDLLYPIEDHLKRRIAMRSNHWSAGPRLRALLLTLALLLAPLPGLAATPAQAASGDCVTANDQTTCTFDFTGEAQTWTVPGGVAEATFELYGAQGGNSFGSAGGLGG